MCRPNMVSAVTLPDRLDHQVPQSSAHKSERGSTPDTAYGIGGAAVWAVILVITRSRTDSHTRCLELTSTGCVKMVPGIAAQPDSKGDTL
jgi:hypothetical protein